MDEACVKFGRTGVSATRTSFEPRGAWAELILKGYSTFGQVNENAPPDDDAQEGLLWRLGGG